VNLDGQYRRSRFFSDFGMTSGSSRRYDYALDLEPNAGPDQRLSFDLFTREVSLLGNPAAGPTDWRDHQDGAGFGLRAGGYWLGLNYSRDDFNVRGAGLLSGATQSYGVSLAPRPSDNTQVSAHSMWRVTDLEGLPGDVRTFDAAATVLHPLDDNVTLTGEVRHFSVDETIVRNAYARRETSGSLEAEYRVQPGTVVTASWRTALTDYVDGLQLNTIGVPSNTVQVRVRSRISPSFKVNSRYSHYSTQNRPLYYHVDQTLGDSLVYSKMTRWDTSATYTPPGPWGLSAQWQQHTWENDAQLISNSIETAMLTGWWQNASGKLSLTASLMRQIYRLPLVDITTLMGYTSRADSAVLGANYTLSDRNTVYATYARALANGATSSEYWRVLLGFSHTAGPQDQLRAEVNFGGYYDDYDPTMDYDADLWRVSYRHQL
jgi:predicted porin